MPLHLCLLTILMKMVKNGSGAGGARRSWRLMCRGDFERVKRYLYKRYLYNLELAAVRSRVHILCKAHLRLVNDDDADVTQTTPKLQWN